MAGIFDTGIFDTGIFDNAGSASALPTNRGTPWKGPKEPEYRIYPEYAAKKRKKKRVLVEGPQVVVESDVTTQTGIIQVPSIIPALDVLGDMQAKQAQADQARLDRLRAIALADDEWLMVA